MKDKTYLKYADVIKITGISVRTFRYRMSELKVKYKDAPELLFKKRHSWRIHVSLITEFNNKQKTKN